MERRKVDTTKESDYGKIYKVAGPLGIKVIVRKN
jgi:hypothetical protein